MELPRKTCSRELKTIVMKPFEKKLQKFIETGRFAYTLEYVPESLAHLDRRGLDFLEQQASLTKSDDRICGVNIGDRVKSMQSLSTVDCGFVAGNATSNMPLLHLAGKDRTPDSVREVFRSAFDKGLDTFLLVTGDAVPTPSGTRPTGNVDSPSDAAASKRIRYVDSVNAIVMAKQMNPECFIAAGVAPFKYREEELLNQYLKMAKKIRAGANYLITNCGWDMRKYQELIWYRDARNFNVPIVANLLLPALGWAKVIHARKLPGVYMSDDLFRLLTVESTLPREERRELQYTRLALQVLGVKLMGYAGVQLSGIETCDDLVSIIDRVEGMEKEIRTLDKWHEAWSAANRFEDGSVVRFGPDEGFYLFGSTAPEKGSMDSPPVVSGVGPDAAELKKFRWLDRADHLFFHEHSLGANISSSLMRGIDHLPGGGKLLRNLEHGVKKSLLGCEMCGFCRLPYMFYVCPETCPKGLSNGPCAGTDENTCEFKDRECVHNKKYRVAKRLGRLDELEMVVVPEVEGTRGTSSWLNLYRGEQPKPTKLVGQASGEEPGQGDRAPIGVQYCGPNRSSQ